MFPLSPFHGKALVDRNTQEVVHRRFYKNSKILRSTLKIIIIIIRLVQYKLNLNNIIFNLEQIKFKILP